LRVTALHVCKDVIVTCLDGDLDVRHHLGEFRNDIHQFIGEVIGMRSEKANALDAIHFMDDTQETCEIRTIRDILAITVNDLTEQSHFLHALRGERTDLRDDIANGTAALDAAPERNDAERTGMRAAVHYRHMRADELSALMVGEDEFIVHHQEAAGCFGVFQGTDFALAQIGNEWPRVGGR